MFSRITWSVTVIRQELLVDRLEFLGGDSEYLVSTSWKRVLKGFRCPIEWVSKGYNIRDGIPEDLRVSKEISQCALKSLLIIVAKHIVVTMSKSGRQSMQFR